MTFLLASMVLQDARRLWSFTNTLLLIAAYCVLHAGLRLLMTDVVEVDHVEQEIYAQSLDWRYGITQPPLYTWLLWSAQKLFGVHQSTLVLLKYSLIFAMFLFFLHGARIVLQDEKLAALSTFSLILLYQIGWKFHHGVTHTLLLTTACCATFYFFARLTSIKQDRWGYVGLGAALGVGLLSKYGFLVFAFALLGSALIVPKSRAVVLNRNFLLSVGVAIGLFMPFGLAVLSDRGGLAATFANTMDVSPHADYVGALGELLAASLGFLSPLLIVVVVLSPQIFFRYEAEPRSGSMDWHSFLVWFHTVVFLVLLGLIFFAGASTFKERWMHPFLVLSPLLVFVRLQGAGFARQTMQTWNRRFVVCLIVTTCIALGYRMGEDLVGPPFCGKCRNLVPFPALAARIKENGFESGTIIAENEHIAGNLRLFFPDSRVLTPIYPYYRPPQDAMGNQYLIVWDAKISDSIPPALAAFARKETRIALDSQKGARDFEVSSAAWKKRWPFWPSKRSDDTVFAWRYLILNGSV